MNAIENTIKKILQTGLKKAFDLEKDPHIETPKDKTHGDYATNLAMSLAKELRMAPLNIAKAIVEHCPKHEDIKAIEVKPPGFINIFIKDDSLFDLIEAILSQGQTYGTSAIGQNQNINIEFVSVNPTGDIHVGHARGAAAGENMTNIMKKAGYNVTKEYYVNDGGNQITNLALSLQARYEQLFDRDTPMPKDGYHGAEIIRLAETIKENYNDQFLDRDDALDRFEDIGVQELLKTIKTDLDRFGVTFDIYFSEKTLYEKDKITDTIKELKDQGFTYEKDGAIWLKTSAYGDEKDRVIIKSDGTYTYVLPDIAYHNDKLSRGYDKLIDILGGDHHGYVPRLKAAIEMLTGQKDKVEVDILQMVKVLQDGKEIKMSKRSGKAITLRDLIDAVGKDAIRYFFARHSLNTHMDLDLDLALKKTNENPVYYAQYAHARIMSLFKKAQESDGLTPQKNLDNYNALKGEEIKTLLKTLSEYPSVIKEAAQTRQFHKLTQYIHTLSANLHSFYAHIPILQNDKPTIQQYLNLLEATRLVLKDGLNLIGVSAPNQM